MDLSLGPGSVVVRGEVVVGALPHAALADVGQLQGDLTGLWSASASDVLRPTFVRTAQSRTTMVSCSGHYDR